MASRKTTRGRSRYGVHPGVFMVQKWRRDLPSRTGRSLDEWLALIARKGPRDERACRAWLKETHGLGSMTAQWLAEQALGDATWTADADAYLRNAEKWVAAMFENRPSLLPAYDALLDASLALGPDVKACPGRTIVPVYRTHVIAQIKPATRTRIDFGLALGGIPAGGRLLDTGGLAKKDRITHRVEVTGPGDVDAELRAWLRAAYDRDAGA